MLCTLWVCAEIIKQKTANEKRLAEESWTMGKRAFELGRRNQVLEDQNKILEASIAFPKEDNTKVLLGNQVELMKIAIPSVLHAVQRRPLATGYGDVSTMQAKIYSSKEGYISVASYGKEYVRELVARELTKWLMDNHFVIGRIDHRRGEIIYGFKYLEHQP